MPVSDRFTEFVVDQLQACGEIASKRMFGGVGVYADDVFFAILDNDVLYLKVDDSNRADFERAGSGPFRPYGDDREVMQYYDVPVDVLEDAAELGRWAAKAIAVARAKKAGKLKPRPGAGKPAARPKPRGRATKACGPSAPVRAKIPRRSKPAGRRRK